MDDDQELSPPVGRPRARKVLGWAVSTLLVVAIALAVFASTNRGPYAFLDKFHPTSVGVDPAHSPFPLPPGSKFQMLVFDDRNSMEILMAMQQELRLDRGFTAEDQRASIKKLEQKVKNVDADLGRQIGSPPQPEDREPVDEDWLFKGKSGGWVEFLSGETGGSSKELLEHGGFTSSSTPTKPACIVVIYYEESWIDRQLAAVRAFFHL